MFFLRSFFVCWTNQQHIDAPIVIPPITLDAPTTPTTTTTTVQPTALAGGLLARIMRQTIWPHVFAAIVSGCRAFARNDVIDIANARERASTRLSPDNRVIAPSEHQLNQLWSPTKQIYEQQKKYNMIFGWIKGIYSVYASLRWAFFLERISLLVWWSQLY